MIKKYKFGEFGGEVVYNYDIVNTKGSKLTVTQAGCAVVSICMPDKNGEFQDIVLGYDEPEKYVRNWMCPGAVIGRYAGRIINSEFKMNGEVYKLKESWPGAPCTLHCGDEGFQYRIWEEFMIDEDANAVTFVMESKDGDQLFPGNLNVKVKYTLSEENEVKIKYECVSDKDTPINLTNHTYFNLAGHDSGSALGHWVEIYSDKVVVVDKDMLATGEIKNVEGSPLDFRVGKIVERDFDLPQDGYSFFTGYDNCYVISDKHGIMKKAAMVKENKSGRVMEVYTDMPGMQFYSSNAVERLIIGKNGASYKEGDALCFETQFLTDAVNNEDFGSPVIRAGEKFESETIYKFSIAK